MSQKPKLFAVAAVLALLLATVGPVAAMVGDDAAGNDSMATAGNDATLSIHVTETADDATVTVTNGTEPVSGANVSVTAVGNATYAGAGEYTSDENGTVSLTAPDEEVEVEIVASAGNQTVSTTTVLGDWEPTFDDDAPFGQHVSRFVHYLLDRDDLDEDKPFGQMVREFVHDQKDKADKQAKKHDRDVESEDDDVERDEKRPDHATDKASDKRPDNVGPQDNDKRPDHAGPDDDDDDERDDDERDDDDAETETSD